MRPLFQRSSLLARQFTLRDFVSVARNRQQLSRPGCLQCQLLIVRRRPYSTGTGSGNHPNGSPPDGQKPPVNEKALENGEGKDPAISEPARIDVTKLPSTIENKRLGISKKFSTAMNDVQGALFVAGKRLNEVTGYAGIEQMKKAIESQEAHVRDSRAEVRAAKEAYQQAINRRSASQREVNELLQRKHAWSPSDLERFTSLYRSDHANEQEEVAAQERLAKAERVADEAQSLLTKNILSRYHEEQIWSDKIRSASTWVTWALMGFNVFLFIIVQLGLEPWRRKRLVGGFEEKVREVIQEEALRTTLLRLEHPVAIEALAKGEPVEEVLISTITTEEGEQDDIPSADDGVMTPAVQEAEEALIEDVIPDMEESNPDEHALIIEETYTVRREEIPWYQEQAEVCKERVSELFSEQVISLRRIDLTMVATGSAAAGAFITGVTVLLWNR